MFLIDKIEDEQTRKFSAACYEMNSVNELINAVEPDREDMNEWGINEDNWFLAIEYALTQKLHDQEGV